MDIGYFPGCAAHGTAVEQDLSCRAVCEALEINLRALDDWNCCGATASHAVAGELALPLGARNIEIAAALGPELLVPCSSCFGNLRRAAQAMKQAQSIASHEGSNKTVEVISITRLLTSPTVIDKIRTLAANRLRGLTIAPYYGCLLVRPPATTGAPDPENPIEIDQIATACGADSAIWSHKTTCCGGPHTVAHPELVEEMSTVIVEMALRVQADIIVTACPMCHASLDTAQWQHRKSKSLKDAPLAGPVPVLYLTELVALAIGLRNTRKWLKRHLISPIPVLASKGIL